MSGPVGALSRNIAAEVKAAMDDPGGWETLGGLMTPAVMPDPYRPADAVMLEAARYATTIEGQRFFAWLRAVSDLAPYPHVTAGGIEQAALAAARHEGRAHVGHLLAKLLAEGERLRRLQNGG